MWEHGYQRFDVDAAAEAGWCDHVKDMYQGLLLRKAKSWFTGYNSNIKGMSMAPCGTTYTTVADPDMQEC